jgi:hypothetical protein
VLSLGFEHERGELDRSPHGEGTSLQDSLSDHAPVEPAPVVELAPEDQPW